MKKLLKLVLIILICNSCNKKNIEIAYFNQSIYDKEIDRINERVIRQRYLNDTLDISFVSINVCNLTDPLIKVVVDSDSLFFTIKSKQMIDSISMKNDSTANNECYSAYKFEFKILGLTPKERFIHVNNKFIAALKEKYKTYPIYFDLTKTGDTINYTDKFGFKQGLWIYKNNDGTLKHIYFRNSEIYRYKTFFKNGNVNSDCICDGHDDFDKDSCKCQIWDESGKQIK